MNTQTNAVTETTTPVAAVTDIQPNMFYGWVYKMGDLSAYMPITATTPTEVFEQLIQFANINGITDLTARLNLLKPAAEDANKPKVEVEQKPTTFDVQPNQFFGWVYRPEGEIEYHPISVKTPTADLDQIYEFAIENSMEKLASILSNTLLNNKHPGNVAAMRFALAAKNITEQIRIRSDVLKTLLAMSALPSSDLARVSDLVTSGKIYLAAIPFDRTSDNDVTRYQAVFTGFVNQEDSTSENLAAIYKLFPMTIC